MCDREGGKDRWKGSWSRSRRGQSWQAELDAADARASLSMQSSGWQGIPISHQVKQHRSSWYLLFLRSFEVHPPFHPRLQFDDGRKELPGKPEPGSHHQTPRSDRETYATQRIQSHPSLANDVSETIHPP